MEALEETKERRVTAVVEMEVAGEAGVRDEAEPTLGDEGGAREGGRIRREAEEDLREEVVILQRPRRRRAGATAAAAATPLARITISGEMRVI